MRRKVRKCEARKTGKERMEEEGKVKEERSEVKEND